MALFVLEQVVYAFSYGGEPVSMPGSVCGQFTPDDWVVPAGSGKFVIPCARMQMAAFTAFPNPDHKTSPLLALTSYGQRALDRINTAAESLHREILERFPLHDVATLRDLLARFTKAMQEKAARRGLNHPA